MKAIWRQIEANRSSLQFTSKWPSYGPRTASKFPPKLPQMGSKLAVSWLQLDSLIPNSYAKSRPLLSLHGAVVGTIKLAKLTSFGFVCLLLPCVNV
jgi:hypothetical protein